MIQYFDSQDNELLWAGWDHYCEVSQDFELQQGERVIGMQAYGESTAADIQDIQFVIGRLELA